MAAYQAQAFNAYVAARLADGTFDQVLAGDVLQTSIHREPHERGWDMCGLDEEAIEHTQRRLESWEAVVTGPLFGELPETPLPQAEGEALEREGDQWRKVAKHARAWRGVPAGRRPIRVQPRNGDIKIEKDDVVISAEFDVDVFPQAMLEEFIQPEGHIA